MAYLTAAEIRERMPSLQSDTEYPDADLDDLVAEFEDIAERYRGVAFTPRSAVDTTTLNRAASLILRPKVRSLTTLTVDGTTVAASGYSLDADTGIVQLLAPFSDWPATTVVATYTHGLDEPPVALLRACRLYVRASALADKQQMGRDVISAGGGDAGTTRFSTPDWSAGRPTGYIDVDRLLNGLPDYRSPGVG